MCDKDFQSVVAQAQVPRTKMCLGLLYMLCPVTVLLLMMPNVLKPAQDLLTCWKCWLAAS